MNCVFPVWPANFGTLVIILVGWFSVPVLPFGAAITMVFVPTWVVVTPGLAGCPALAMGNIDVGIVLIMVVMVFWPAVACCCSRLEKLV